MCRMCQLHAFWCFVDLVFMGVLVDLYSCAIHRLIRFPGCLVE